MINNFLTHSREFQVRNKVVTPIEQYQQAIQSGEYIHDPQQEIVAQALQHLYEQIIEQENKSLLLYIKSIFKQKDTPQGLYIWGSVGAGKTWLMDMFYHCLPDDKKFRLHFHHFMQQVHHHLKQLQGQRDPLKIIAKQFAQQSSVICFDEFFVLDITDAMILANLLEALFNEGIILITTSNIPPDELYRNGLQRNRFLPAIALLKKQTQIISLQSQADYRLRELKQAGVYFCPLSDQNTAKIQQLFNQLTHSSARYNQALQINDREIKTIACTQNVVWFEFNILCHVPRSQMDYLDIAKTFHTVFLSNVPKIAAQDVNSARYLINLIDILYDKRVKLIMSAAVPILELYIKGELHFAFQRTCSRLLEMQSEEYLHLAHLTS